MCRGHSQLKIKKNLSWHGKRFINVSKSLLDPYWVTGFSDAEGCFTVIMNQREKDSDKWRVSVSFEINLHTKDIHILYLIQQFFATGSVINRKDRSISVYRVTNVQNICKYILPHFDKYNLITQKYSDYILWKEVVLLMLKKEHLKKEGFKQILNNYSSINRGPSKLISKTFLNIVPTIKMKHVLPENLNPFWVSGFAAGDGGFYIGIRPKTKQIFFRFQITQHSKDLELIKLFITFFKSGYVNKRKNDNRCDYYIQDAKLIKANIISHFERYPLCNIKTIEYLDFNKALNLFLEDKKNNLEKIKMIFNRLNTKRK